MPQILKNFINGQWVGSKGSKFLNVLNPANGKLLARVPAGSKDDIQEAAETAHQSWSSALSQTVLQYMYLHRQLHKA